MKFFIEHRDLVQDEATRQQSEAWESNVRHFLKRAGTSIEREILLPPFLG
jgi:fibrillarin-like rRNA methylase